MKTWNRTAVVVVAKQPVLDWLRSVDPTSADLTLEELCKEPTVYLLDESKSDQHAEKLLADSCARMFEEELNGWYQAPETWPDDRSIKTFQRWFTYTVHSMIVDLCERPVMREEL